MAEGLITGSDEKARCWWCGEDPLYIAYHDQEWGRPVTDDVRLFEKLCLEGFQSGLSWLTILKKRENFRAAFDAFDFKKVARYDEDDVKRLLQDSGIIRHQGKIRSTINNAQRMIELLSTEKSFYVYLQQFKPSEASRPQQKDYENLSKLAIIPESVAMAKDLKKRGFSFVGPTTAYAFMQAMGMVNDHLDGCHVEKECCY